MTHISDTAESAREAHRSADGRFGTQPALEADLDLSGTGEQVAHAAHGAVRTYTTDVSTGQKPPVRRHYSWFAEDDSADFAMWTEDLTNTPYESLSDEAKADLAAMVTHVRQAAATDNTGDADEIAGAAFESYAAQQSEPVSYAEEEGAWVAWAHAELGSDPGIDDDVRSMMDQVQAHEADGGLVVVDQYDGSVRWVAGHDDNSPLFRACTASEGLPAAFDAHGNPTQWVRGTTTTRLVTSEPDGYSSDTRFDWRSGRPTVTTRSDGSFEHYDLQAPDPYMWGPPAGGGPAKFDLEGAAYCDAEPSVISRDPDVGPALVCWDGEVRYFNARGLEIDPTPQQARAQGVVAEEVPWGSGSTRKVYRAAGSNRGERFDWAGHPLDHGHRLKDQGSGS